MKACLILRSFLLLFVLASTQALAHAQTAPAAAQPGYWNLETNRTTRDHTIVRFYNGQDQLVYEESLPGTCLDLSRHPRQGRRTKTQLDAALQQVLRNPASGQPNTLVAAQLRQPRRVQHGYAVR